MRVVERAGGALVREMRLENLRLDPALPRSVFVVQYPAGIKPKHTDAGFQRLEVRALKDAVGYRPLVPTWTPSGFTVTEVTAAEKSQPTGKEGMNPSSGSVVSLGYRRSFDRFVLSTRSVGPASDLWSDPLASGEGFVDRPESRVLERGPFAGATAEILINMTTVPHLWVVNGGLVLTVACDLTTEELVEIAESLVPYEG